MAMICRIHGKLFGCIDLRVGDAEWNEGANEKEAMVAEIDRTIAAARKSQIEKLVLIFKVCSIQFSIMLIAFKA